jgi:hypothetical protein
MTGLVPIVLWFAAICTQDPAAPAGGGPIIDNERVAIWDTTWTSGTRPIRHDHAFITIYVTGGTSPKKPGDVEFDKKGSALRAGPGARTIEIELKDHPVSPLPNTSGYPDAFPRPGVKRMLDNDRVTVWDVTWLPGVATPLHYHGYDAIAVYLENGALKATTADGHGVVNEYFPGFTKFNPRNRIHSEQLVTGGSERAIVVDLK